MFGDTLRIIGMNKTSVDIRENPNADKIANYRYFVEGADKFDELGRDRLKTSRAKNYYVLTAKNDDKYTYIQTIFIKSFL
ncbi:hypothetical protein [Campylobacter iguaniorum]|uniref:hypothetical protein n=1 Tax=Campylobacter iguaniorum TaxID=1244531 RepID=UPI000ADA3256|nr:hypothetical protein [Campylobacter iguaniorum]